MTNKLVPLSVLYVAITSMLCAAAALTLEANPIVTALAILGALGVSLFVCWIATRGWKEQRGLQLLNTVSLGLLAGTVCGLAAWIPMSWVFAPLFKTAPLLEGVLRIILFASTSYLGIAATYRAANQLSVCIPFVRLDEQTVVNQKIVVDASILADPRILDLANSGLLHHRLVLPRFILRDISDKMEHEESRPRANRMLQAAQQLQSLPNLSLIVSDEDFPELSEVKAKTIKFARQNHWSLLTAEMSRIEQASTEGVEVINIHELARLLQPITKHGETIDIKIQRYGKEPMQGVGYLDDGTMVVVNGGGEFIGETISAQVLSVKHTASGRMIFCNAQQSEQRTEQHRDLEREASKDRGRTQNKDDYFLV